MQQDVREVSGHVFLRRGKRGARWYMKYRLPNGRQVQRTIGPAWTSKREKPPPGHFTTTGAQAVLDETLARVRRGELGGVVRTGATFAEAADEWLRYVERDRERKASTITDYRHTADRLKRALRPSSTHAGLRCWIHAGAAARHRPGRTTAARPTQESRLGAEHSRIHAASAVSASRFRQL